MKSDEDVKMVSAEAPVLFAKACEIFIMELTNRAWMFTEEGKRRTLQKVDIAACIQNTEIFDFLIDVLPKKDQNTTQNKQKGNKEPQQEVFPTVNQLGLGQGPAAPQQERSINSNQQQQYQGQQQPQVKEAQQLFSDRFLQNTPTPQAENSPCLQQVQIMQGNSSLRQYQLPKQQNTEQQQQTPQQLKFSQQLQSQQPQQKTFQQYYSHNNNFNLNSTGIKEVPQKYYDLS